MFGWEFPPHITGGLGTACFGMTKGLAKNGVEVLFVVPKAHGDEDQSSVRLLNASEVTVNIDHEADRSYWDRVQYMEIGSNIIPYVGPEQYSSMVEEYRHATKGFHSSVFAPRYEFSGKYGANLMEEVARYALVGSSLATKYDFTSYMPTTGSPIPPAWPPKTTGKPLVVHMHATEFDRSGENINTDVFAIEKRGMEMADMVITVSDWTKKIVVEKYGINPNKIVTVHNAVEPIDKSLDEYERSGLKNKVVTFLGRITYQKGPEYFVEAAHKILQVDPDIHFVMAGTGDMLNKMVRRVAQLKMGANFHFTGFLKGNDVDQMFAMTDVFVMPSISEPFGIVPLEAMRLNVPVVISKQSGVSEVVKHALKVDFWDINGLADAIYGLCKYKAVSDIFRKEGKEEVDNLKWEYASKKIKAVYNNVLSNND